TRAVTRATDSLTAAADAVSRSVQEKRNAEAAAAAEAERQQQEAQRAARTWTMRNAQGYTFTASLEVGSPTTTLTVGDYRLGQSCGFDPALDIAIPVTMTVTSTTEGFETPISA